MPGFAANTVNERFHATVREGNRFALLSDGAEFFARILAAIDAAQNYVLVECYLVESGRVVDDFIAAFARATQRGVRVRALSDAFGARRLSEGDRARLKAAQVEVAFCGTIGWRTFPRFFLRNHRKLLIADGVVGFTGGTGLADMFSPAARPNDFWLDCIVEITGPVLDDWHALFAGTWKRCENRELDVVMHPAAARDPGVRGRVAISRGVDVRLLLPGPHTDAPAARGAGRLFYVRLPGSGVVIYEYQPSFLHAKVVLCDDWASVGSSNLDRLGGAVEPGRQSGD